MINGDNNHDAIRAPDHYTWHPTGIECATIVDEFPYHIGTAMAYLWRHAHKGCAAMDLRKAIQHIEMELVRREARGMDE